ncbi:MAG: hypothetical protein Q9218_005809 [Villophora microphyllina]
MISKFFRNNRERNIPTHQRGQTFGESSGRPPLEQEQHRNVRGGNHEHHERRPPQQPTSEKPPPKVDGSFRHRVPVSLRDQYSNTMKDPEFPWDILYDWIWANEALEDEEIQHGSQSELQEHQRAKAMAEHKVTQVKTAGLSWI